jgi:hypothetical protein
LDIFSGSGWIVGGHLHVFQTGHLYEGLFHFVGSPISLLYLSFGELCV